MKCPKCGYNSFEYHSNCKKCSADLVDYKKTFDITAIVLPPDAMDKQADRFRNADSVNEQPSESVEKHDDMFSFDLPEEIAPSASTAVKNDDPFNFNYELPETDSQQAKAQDEGFADLLESTSNSDDPFALSVPSAPSPQPATETSETGEFELENFSWDSTPAATASETAPGISDDFDSLFGDTSDSAKK